MAMATPQKSQEFLTRRALHAAVMNPVGSKTFLKKMVPMALSFILHQRVELDESDFNTRCYGGIKYKVFKPKMRNKMLQEVSHWTNGAMDALDKNYLRELYLVFESNEEAGKVHESYKFQFKYMGTDVIPLETQMSTKRELEDATNCLLTAIQSLNAHKAFKENEVTLKMAMTYYEDVTPSDYQPPFFKTERENGTSVLQSLAMQPRDYLHLGVMKTGYHIVKCRAKGDVFSLNRSLSSTTNINDETMNAVADPTPDTAEQYEDAVETPVVQNSYPITIEELPEPNSQVSSKPDVLLTPFSQISDKECFTLTDENFQCACTISVRLDDIDTVLCSQCLTFQHCVCLGYLKGTELPNTYVCPQCDEGINDLTPGLKDRLNQVSIYRLIVAVAYFSKEVPEGVLKMFSKPTADLLFKKLIEQQIILGNGGKFRVNMKLIEARFLNALFSMSNPQKKKIIPNSMTLEDVNMSQENSMVLGGDTYGKR